MYKVLIADDEKNVCMLISKLVNWKSMNMEIVQIVHNSIDAYKCILSLEPDIVISDIRMPGYDGLELINKSLQLDKKPEFIIISGYKYFEYAHKALSMGVEHYLLKPINKTKLETALTKIIKKIQFEKQAENEKEELNDRIQVKQEKINKHFLTNILMDKGDNTDRSTWYNELNFSNNYFQAVVIKIDSQKKNGSDFSSLLSILEDSIDSRLKELNCEYINATIKSGIISIINFNSEVGHIATEVYDNLLDYLTYELKKFNMFSVTIGVGVTVNHIGELRKTIHSSINAVKCRVRQGVDRVIFAEKLHYNIVDLNKIVNENHKKKLENIIEALDSNAFHQFINNIYEEIKRVPFYSPIYIFDMLELIFKISLPIIKKSTINQIDLVKLEEEFESIIDTSISEETMIKEVKKITTGCLEKLLQNKKNRMQMPVRLAKQYIQGNYDKQITLEDVGNEVDLSSAYLSNIFKKEVGINFSDYLINCRIEAAKELLKSTNISIGLISEKVGYKDQKHFSKMFFKVVGLKPSVYRKVYS